MLILGLWRVSEIILWGLALCLTDNKQSINDRNYYRENFVSAIFLRKATVHYRKTGCVMAFALTFLQLENKNSGPKSWLIYMLCLWTAKLSLLWFSERNKGQWHRKLELTTKWTLPELSFGWDQNRLSSLVMNCGRVSRQTWSVLGSLHTYRARVTTSVLWSRRGERFLQWICQEDKKNIPTANVLPKWQVTSFSGLLFFWLQGTPGWTALGLWKMWLPRKVVFLQKLQVDNGSDLQEGFIMTYLIIKNYL